MRTGLLAFCALPALFAAGVAATAPSAARASGGVYTNCAACHGADGEGGFGPAFRDNPRLAQSDYVIAILLAGGGDMPAFGEQLDDAEIATVASTIRSRWNNHYGAVSPADVARLRKTLAH